jgi:replicative DNA helicase
MEKHILSAMLGSRESFYLIMSYITTRLYSREFQIIIKFIKSYYDRDENAQLVDRTLLAELIAAQTANEKHTEKFLKAIDEALLLETSDANVKMIVLNMKKKELGQELAIANANGDDSSEQVETYREIMKYTDLDELTDRGVEVYDTKDLDDLINHEIDPTTRMIVYPLSLNERLDGGLRGSDHMTIMARPEMGKTGLVLTMACGFARQGKVGIVFNNEERIERLRMRGLSCATGMTIQEIRNNPQAAKDIAEQVGFHNIIFISLSPGTVHQIDHFVEKYKAKWFIVDQLRNLAMKAENRTNQLEAAAVGIRNIGKRYDAASISITQAGDSAEGKAVLTMGDVDNSNTGIPGACDVLLGVGATDDQKALGIRVLSLSKNKLGGVHVDWPVRFNPFLSKYVSMNPD